MASEQNAAAVEAGIWEALHSLVDQARFASECGDTGMYQHRHHQIDHLLTQWQAERGVAAQRLPEVLDRIKLVRGI